MESTFDSQFLVIKGARTTWYRPTKLDDLLYLKLKYPEARIVVGNTEVGKLHRDSFVSSHNQGYTILHM
jgi:xanthine dehydrogenase/oxidase